MSSVRQQMTNRCLRLCWEAACVASIVGIWARHIEPFLLGTTRLLLPVAGLPKALEGLRIVQFSDLHLSTYMSDSFLEKLRRRVMELDPQLIVFTGDFLCYARLEDRERLRDFLRTFKAPLGCYCIYGNHDYQAYVAVNAAGDYARMDKEQMEISKGLCRLFYRQPVNGRWAEGTEALAPHEGLVELLKETPFVPLHNCTVQIPVGDSRLNLCGVGEYMARQFRPELAFEQYDPRFPGIVLAHNPDCIVHLRAFPGQVILCGHTHGGQLNVPGLRDRFMVAEHPEFAYGLFRIGDKWAFVSRGVGGTFRLRLRARPEVVCVELTQEVSSERA